MCRACRDNAGQSDKYHSYKLSLSRQAMRSYLGRYLAMRQLEGSTDVPSRRPLSLGTSCRAAGDGDGDGDAVMALEARHGEEGEQQEEEQEEEAG